MHIFGHKISNFVQVYAPDLHTWVLLRRSSVSNPSALRHCTPPCLARGFYSAASSKNYPPLTFICAATSQLTIGHEILRSNICNMCTLCVMCTALLSEGSRRERGPHPHPPTAIYNRSCLQTDCGTVRLTSSHIHCINVRNCRQN